MKGFWFSRRTFVATLAIIALGVLGYFKSLDVSIPIAMIATGFAGANAIEGGYSSYQQSQTKRLDSAQKPVNPGN